MEQIKQIRETLERIKHWFDVRPGYEEQCRNIKQALSSLDEIEKRLASEELVYGNIIKELAQQAFLLGHSKRCQGFLIIDEHMEHCQPHIDSLTQAAINVIRGGDDEHLSKKS